MIRRTSCLAIIVVAGALVLSACVTQESAVPTAAVSDDSSQLDCRRIRTTGSRVPERICRSSVEWERLAEEDREILREVQRDSAISSGNE